MLPTAHAAAITSPSAAHPPCSGVPFELKARDYTAEMLSAALGKERTSRDVVAISAMEGIGVAGGCKALHRPFYNRDLGLLSAILLVLQTQ